MGAIPEMDEAITVPILRPAGTLDEQRRRRAEALKAAEGIWKNRADMPRDGVAYQEQLRDEWR